MVINSSNTINSLITAVEVAVWATSLNLNKISENSRQCCVGTMNSTVLALLARHAHSLMGKKN